MKKMYADTIELLQEQKRGEGKDISLHLLNGAESYRNIFYALIKMVDKHEETGFWIERKELLRRSKVHTSNASFILHKFESEDYLRVKDKKVYVDAYQVESWKILCGILQASRDR